LGDTYQVQKILGDVVHWDARRKRWVWEQLACLSQDAMYWGTKEKGLYCLCLGDDGAMTSSCRGGRRSSWAVNR
jgi:hypothetical protein